MNARLPQAKRLQPKEEEAPVLLSSEEGEVKERGREFLSMRRGAGVSATSFLPPSPVNQCKQLGNVRKKERKRSRWVEMATAVAGSSGGGRDGRREREASLLLLLLLTLEGVFLLPSSFSLSPRFQNEE